MANNNPFYQTPANPYAWNSFTPGASYAPQTVSYMAEEPNYHPNNIAHSAWGGQLYSLIKWALKDL